MLNAKQYDIQHLHRKYLRMDLRNVLVCMPYHVDNHYSVRIVGDSMVLDQYNFQRMNKLDDLVSLGKLRMGRMVMVSMDFGVLEY